jgi:hypothetical protein
LTRRSLWWDVPPFAQRQLPGYPVSNPYGLVSTHGSYRHFPGWQSSITTFSKMELVSWRYLHFLTWVLRGLCPTGDHGLSGHFGWQTRGSGMISLLRPLPPPLSVCVAPCTGYYPWCHGPPIPAGSLLSLTYLLCMKFIIISYYCTYCKYNWPTPPDYNNWTIVEGKKVIYALTYHR